MLHQVATMLCFGTGAALIAATLLVSADEPLRLHIAMATSAIDVPALRSGSSMHFKTSDAWWRPGANPVVGEQVRRSRQLHPRNQRRRNTGAENWYWI